MRRSVFGLAGAAFLLTEGAPAHAGAHAGARKITAGPPRTAERLPGGYGPAAGHGIVDVHPPAASGRQRAYGLALWAAAGHALTRMPSPERKPRSVSERQGAHRKISLRMINMGADLLGEGSGVPSVGVRVPRLRVQAGSG